MEAVAAAGAFSGAGRGGRRERLGWAIFALSCAFVVAALALDLHTGRYKTLSYLGVNVALALIGVLLTTRRPEHPISWVLAIIALWGTLGGLAYAYAVQALVAAHHGERQAVYTLNQVHSYDWLGWNAAFAAVLLATGLGARRTGILPAALSWATVVVGASLLTPLAFFGFMLLPLWLIVVGIWLSRVPTSSPVRSRDEALLPDVAAGPAT
jgi:hypothetical protein